MHISLRRASRLGVVAGAIVLTMVPTWRWAKAQSDTGNIIIADQYNNRVIEVDRATHQVVWTFGDGSDIAGPHSVVGVNDVERIGPLTLISGTGTPPGAPGLLRYGQRLPRQSGVHRGQAGQDPVAVRPGGRRGLRRQSAEHSRAGRISVRISGPPRFPRDHRRPGQPAHHRGERVYRQDRVAIRHNGRGGEWAEPAQQSQQRRGAGERPHPDRR